MLESIAASYNKPELRDIVFIDTGDVETCAIDRHGEIFCWGETRWSRPLDLPQ